MPVNEQEWLEKEAEFHDIFPHCLAAMDGKHVVTLSPINSGSEYFNYKHAYSIVLLALVDRNYRFMFADVGCQGRISDGGVFRNSSLFRELVNNTLNLPTHSTLPDCSNHAMPYVFVADNAFPLHTNIMKPYPGDHQEGSIKRIFNKHLSRARIIVENVFGVMSAVFRVLRKPISLQPDRASNVVMACVLLHNFLRNSRTNNFYTPPGFMDSILDGEVVPGTWRQEQQADGALRSLPAVARRSALMPMQIRDKFAEYFASRYN